MPNREYVSIIFSHVLEQAPPNQKIKALKELYRYLSANGVAVGDIEGGLDEIAENLFHPDLDLTGHFQSGVLTGTFNPAQQETIVAIGFAVWKKEVQMRLF